VLQRFDQLQFCIKVDYDTKRVLFQEPNQDDEDGFRSFLFAFRKFILNDEPANIDWVLNTCQRFVKEDETELKKVLNELKTIWGYAYRTGYIRMETNSSEGRLNLTPEYVLDLWLNADYVHNTDVSKEKQLAELMAQEPPSVKAQLLYSLPKLTEIIIGIGDLVSKALEKEVFSFPDETHQQLSISH
jgi:hypothetical protein